MAVNFQVRSRARKLVYLGLILLLFTLSLMHRQFIIEPAATALQMRADTQGEVELTSSAVRVLLFGSRGIAASILWSTALEKQKRHQWNELELVVSSITTLQPNFVTPWLFQSWNLAFNVSVECDRTRDKYFYISRGIQLLAEGERRHQGSAIADAATGRKFPGNPDMRFHLAGYYLRKIGLSDDRNAMRSLFELSCIDPLHRDPNIFLPPDEKGRRVINLKKFREFCQQNPRLVRRLKRRLRCSEPRDVIAFLERNQGIPSRFDESRRGTIANQTQTPLLAADEQFPILPPPVNSLIPNREEREFDEVFDVFVAARAWYAYANEPLPPPSNDLEADQTNIDPMKYRLPKMMAFLFRSFLPRSQEYVAETRQEEGFFDAEGWVITNWFADPSGSGDEVVAVGRESKYHSTGAWNLAYKMYEDYGVKHRLLLPADQQEALEKAARLYQRTYVLNQDDETASHLRQDPRKLDPEMRKSRDAHLQLMTQKSWRTLSNFEAHYYQCRTERLPEVAAVRKLFFQAEELENQSANIPQAMVTYRQAFDNWLALLLHYPEYRALEEVQKETYQWEQQYLGLLEEQNEEILRPLAIGIAQLGTTHACALSPALNVTPAALLHADRRRIVPMRNVSGPMEWVYLYQSPVRQELQEYLLALTQATQHPPFALSAYQRDWMLTAVSRQDRRFMNPGQLRVWVPLIASEVIEGGGFMTRLERRFLR